MNMGTRSICKRIQPRDAQTPRRCVRTAVVCNTAVPVYHGGRNADGGFARYAGNYSIAVLDFPSVRRVFSRRLRRGLRRGRAYF